MTTATSVGGLIRVGTLAELQEKGCLVVRGADRPIAVFHEQGHVYAVDNRCPHMGFPLSRGSIQDGMITCHWHHARFDSASGCTFDLFADDVPAYDVVLNGPEVFVAPRPRNRDLVAHATRRLEGAMEKNIGLIAAKSILTLRSSGVDESRVVRQIAQFGLRNRDGMGPGLVVLAAIANLLPDLSDRTAYLGFYQAARRVAADCEGQTPHRNNHPLETDGHDAATLRRWLGYWTSVRHRDGAERTLLTALASPTVIPQDVTEMFFTAASQRFYADGGHVFDFSNKAYELLATIGYDQADQVLPAMVPQTVRARGGEENNSWRHPIDLVAMVKDIEKRLPELFLQGKGHKWSAEAALAEAMLVDDPVQVMGAITGAIEAGAQPRQLSKALAYAATLRVARFGTANELGDWVSALHSFSYCNAVDQTMARVEGESLMPAVIHGAVSVYLNRFLNVPPAKLPGERALMDKEPTDPGELQQAFLDALDSQHQVNRAALLVARYLELQHSAGPLLDMLVFAVLREDFDFHSLQMVEAGIRQYRRWGDTAEGHTILIAVARYLAAHSPTMRGQLQAANIAARLHRGEDLTAAQE